MKLGDLQVNVLCDDHLLEEYRPTQDEPHTLTCSIPSEAGKAFKILSTNNSPRTALVGKLYLDGCRVRTFRLLPGCTHIADCVYISHSVRRPFLFSEMEIADDGRSLRSTEKLLKNVGVIQVDFYRCELGSEEPWFSRGVKDMALGQFPEGYDVHQIELGTQQYLRNKRLHSTKAKLLDPKEWPYARFVFRYQSQDVLEAHGVIPRPLGQALLLPRRTESSQYHMRRATLQPIPANRILLAQQRPISISLEKSGESIYPEEAPLESIPSLEKMMLSVDHSIHQVIACGRAARCRRRSKENNQLMSQYL